MLIHVVDHHGMKQPLTRVRLVNYNYLYLSELIRWVLDSHNIRSAWFCPHQILRQLLVWPTDLVSQFKVPHILGIPQIVTS